MSLLENRFKPIAADLESLGGTSLEMLNIYVGDAGRIYLGLDQAISLRRVSPGVVELDAAMNIASDLLWTQTNKNFGPPSIDDAYLKVVARDNGAGLVEVGRIQGAAEPRLGHMLPINLRSPAALTIATGVITVGVAAAGAWYTVDTEAATATDDLDTINGGATGDVIILKALNDARTVVVKHATGNLQLNGVADFSMDNSLDTLMLVFDGANWLEIARSSNGI